MPARCWNVYGSSLTVTLFDDEDGHPADDVAVTLRVTGLELRTANVMVLVAAPAVIDPPEIVHAYVAPSPASGIDAVFPVESPCTLAGAVIVVFGGVRTVTGISLETTAGPQAGVTVTTT